MNTAPWVLATLLVASVASGCGEKSGPSRDPGNNVEPISTATDAVRPRIVLDGDTLAALKKAAAAESPAFKTLRERCRVFSSGDKSSGYLGLQWAEAVISLTLCWHATEEERYADLAVRYLTALIDDREAIGDGKGGDKEVRRNSGYPIRAHGVGAALGYDWLYKAKAMTPALRQRIASRLKAWLDWYAKDGYLNDNPFANYFWGYMGSLALAGLALDGESDYAAGWLADATKILELKVIPGFAEKLSGGTWAEGWQYGPLVAVSLSLVVRGFATARDVDYADKLPWFREIIRSQLHRMHPPRETSYSNGTHRVKPSLPNPTPLQAAIFMLGSSEPERAAEARYIEKKLLPRLPAKYPWFALLASLSGNDQSDPLDDEPLSYHLAGPGLTFARSSWDRRAVWTSFQAGAKIAVDHQHNDQGHFELWRGADALFVDGGDTEAFATINHNTLLVDDAGRTLNYSPNQGVWARDSRTVGYSDDGRAVVVVGDLAGAWDPKCALRGCKERTVKRARRTWIYVRPNVLVIDDSVEVESERDRVSWAVHVRAKPTIKGSSAAVEVGGSRADLAVLLPTGARLRAPKEPTTSDNHIYRRNLPRGDVWRIEIPSKSGAREREFRVWMGAANRGAEQAPARSRPGKGFESVLGSGLDRDVAVLFAKTKKGGEGMAFPGSVVVAVGLEAKAKYNLSSTLRPRQGVRGESDTCSVKIVPSARGNLLASDAGSISVLLDACKPSK